MTVFDDKIMSNGRKLDSYVIVGATTYNSNKIIDWNFHDSVSISDKFEIGTAVANTFEITLQDVTGSFNLLTVEPFIGVEVTPGSFSYISLGKFNVDNILVKNISPTQKNVTLECFDAMPKLDIPYEWVAGDTDTMKNIVTRISTLTGVPIGSISIVTNFVGKVAGSTVENPHKHFRTENTTLALPTGSWTESDQSLYDATTTINGLLFNKSTTVNAAISQQRFSLDIIQHLERKHGKAIWDGKTLLADKIAIAKVIVTNIVFNWHGYGSSPTGNKASVSIWLSDSNSWQNSGAGFAQHTNGTVTKLSVNSSKSYSTNKPTAVIDSNGFIHLIAYAEASNGTVISAINTDYIDFVVSVNPLLSNITLNKVEGYTCREVLGFCAGVVGGNAIIDRNSGIAAKTYAAPTTPVLTITGDHYNEDGLEKGIDTYTIGQISGYDKKGGTFISGTVTNSTMSVYMENPFLTQAIVDVLGASLIGLSYIPFKMEWMGNPAISAGDIITIDEYQVAPFTTIVTDSVITYPHFGMISKMEVEGKTTNAQLFSDDLQLIEEDLEVIKQELTGKESVIEKSATPPPNPVLNAIWIDTSSIPNQMKRWNGTEWVKLTPVVPEDIGAVTQAYVDNALAGIEAGSIPVSATAPSNPSVDDLWIDTTTNPPTMKRWSGSIWTKVMGGQITGDQIAVQTIAAGSLVAGTITGNEIAANTITGAKIAAATIDATNIKAGTITGNEIKANTITSALISTAGLDAAVIKTGTLSAITISGGSINHSGSFTEIWAGVSVNFTTLVTVAGGKVSLKDTSASRPYMLNEISSRGVWIGANTLSVQASRSTFDRATEYTQEGQYFYSTNSTTPKGYMKWSQLNGTLEINNEAGNGGIYVYSGTSLVLMADSGVGAVNISGGDVYIDAPTFTWRGSTVVTANSSPTFNSLTVSGTTNLYSTNFTGNIQMNSNSLNGVGTVNTVSLNVSGTTFLASTNYTGNLQMNSNNMNGVGTITATTVRYGTLTQTSDRDLKKNIIDWTGNATELIAETPIRQFHYLEELDSELPHIGVILQESPVEIAVPTGTGVDTANMVALSWKSLQELNNMVKDLQERVNTLETIQ